MNITGKKILAREFLLFMILLALCIVVLLGLIGFDTYYNTKSKAAALELDPQYIENASKLNASYKTKIRTQEWFYNQFEDVETSKVNSPKKLWKILNRIARNDSITHRWNNLWAGELVQSFKKIGFSTPMDLQTFVIRNSITKDDIMKVQEANSIILKHDQSSLKYNQFRKKIMGEDKIKESLLIAFYILFCLIFILRYLYYAIMWSIKILRA